MPFRVWTLVKPFFNGLGSSRRADKKAGRRNPQLELRGLVDGDESCRAVFGVEEGREEGVALAQIEQIQGLFPAERMQRARGGTFLLDLPKPPPDAVELVGGGKAQHVRERVPLEDARVHVDLVPGDRVGRHPPVGKAQRGCEMLRAVGTHSDARGELLARQRAVALYADSDRTFEDSERNKQQPEERP